MTAENPRKAPASDYDTFVNWEVRLARETPFFRSVFDEVGAKCVIDVGAGTCRHAIEYAKWGMAVDAVDPDASMLEAAEDNIAAACDEIAGAGGELRLVRGGFGDLCGLGLGAADALTCTGNALPHVAGMDGLRDALVDFSEVLRPGGALVLHLLNHSRLLAKKQRSIMPVVREVPEGTRVFLRVIDYPAPGGEFLGFDFVTMVRNSAGEWTCAAHKAAHTLLPIDMLSAELEAAGFDRMEAFGGHDRKPFDAEQDESVLVVARRAG